MSILRKNIASHKTERNIVKNILFTILLTVVVPLAAGILLGRCLGRQLELARAIAPAVAAVAIVIICSYAVAANQARIADVGGWVIAVVIIVNALGYLAGWIVALFVVAEPLKRLGKYTFTDALDSKFNSKGIQLAAAISTLVVSLFYLIPQMVGGVKPTALIAVPMFIFAADIITKGHGGDLKVKTAVGEGTEFIITLPENGLNGYFRKNAKFEGRIAVFNFLAV